MLYYLARRVLGAAAVLVGVVTGTFLLSHVVPADPARAAAGIHASPAQVQAVARSLGLYRPIWDQYVTYMGGLLHGDLGISYGSRQPIGPAILRYLPATLELVFWSFLIYVVVGIGVGIVWAWRDQRPEALLIRLGSMVGTALPIFWVAIVLQLWLASRLNWFPITGRFSFHGTPPPTITGFYTLDSLLARDPAGFLDAAHHLVLPALTLVVWMFPVAARMTQKSILDEMGRPYVRTAIAKGATTRWVLLRHVLRNAINPVVSMLGMQFGWLMGGTVLVEVVYSWPGIGNYMYTALQIFDFPAIMAVTLIVTAAFVVVNLLVDLVYPALDPRIRIT